MKRVFQHPPEPLTGKHYWRSVNELSDTLEFREWLEREFPAGAAELKGDEWSRRSFLKLMGASMALAGFGFAGAGRACEAGCLLRRAIPERFRIPRQRNPTDRANRWVAQP